MPTDCDAVDARRTRATRRSNWKRSFTRITTWRGGGGSRWRTVCAWQSARLKSGSRTAAWNSKRRSKPSRSSTSRTKRRISTLKAEAPIRPRRRRHQTASSTKLKHPSFLPLFPPRPQQNTFFFLSLLTHSLVLSLNFSASQSLSLENLFISFLYTTKHNLPNLCLFLFHPPPPPHICPCPLFSQFNVFKYVFLFSPLYLHILLITLLPNCKQPKLSSSSFVSIERTARTAATATTTDTDKTHQRRWNAPNTL